MKTKTVRRAPEAKREAVLAAALALFARQGYHGTQTKDVAARAEVAVGTVFRIFKTKEELANAVYLACDARNAAYVGPAIAAPATSPREKFAQLWQAMARFYQDDPDAFTFYEIHAHGGYLDDEGRLARARHKAAIQALIKRWQAAGALTKASHEAIRALVIGSFGRLVREGAESPFPVTSKLLAELEELVWRAIRA